MSYYQRGHSKQDSFAGGGGVVPPLSATNTLVLQAGFAIQGMGDAMKLQVAGEKLTGDRIVQANVLKSSVIQGIVLFSALVIKPILRRAVGLRAGEGITSSVILFGFHLFWLYPLAAAATYYSGLLRPTQETDKRSVRGGGGMDNKGMAVRIVSESYRTLVTLNYFLFFYALRMIPLLGAPLSFAYASIVDAYYCFEGHWVKQGWSFGDRVRQVEQRWAYAVGFGFPITILSWWSSDPIVNLAVFALLYPLFSLTSTVAIPQPLDPSFPGSASSKAPSFLHSASGLGYGSISIAAAEGGEESRGRKGSAYVPVRIRVLLVAEMVYGALTAAFGAGGGAGGGRKKDAGMGHGMGRGTPSRGGASAYGAAASSFDSSAYGGNASSSHDTFASNNPYAATTPSRYSAESNPYGPPAGSASASTYAPSPASAYGTPGVSATPPRRGYAAVDPNSNVAELSPGGSMYQQQMSPTRGGQAGMGGYGGDRALDSYIRQAGLRGKNKGD
ncbi:Protein EI24 [Rhodotorula toruloides]|nr:Protein EI24 [Rhodotorula toruloides]